MVVAVLLMPLARSARGQAPSQPVFRTGVDMVVLRVTVTEAGRRYVSDLDMPDFTVLEDGRPQRLSFFSRARTPIALSLLLDTSTSMEPMLPLAQDAAVTFARRLGSDDVAQVVAFSNAVSILQPFTGSPQELESAIRRTRAGGPTSMFTALYVALSELRNQRAKDPAGLRRQAVVLLSDGEDTSSLVPFEQVLELAQHSDVAIYAIALVSPDHSAGAFDEGKFVLRQLTQATGGRVFEAQRPQDLTNVYAQVADELANQYTLAYAPANSTRDQRWRTIAVQVSRPDCVARTRAGYVPRQ
jgi:Ca-activated chloride channel family protein